MALEDYQAQEAFSNKTCLTPARPRRWGLLIKKFVVLKHRRFGLDFARSQIISAVWLSPEPLVQRVSRSCEGSKKTLRIDCGARD